MLVRTLWIQGIINIEVHLLATYIYFFFPDITQQSEPISRYDTLNLSPKRVRPCEFRNQFSQSTLYFCTTRLLYHKRSSATTLGVVWGGLHYKLVLAICSRNIVNVILWLFHTDVHEIRSSECLLNPGRTVEGTKEREGMETWRLLDILCIHVRQNHDNCIELRNSRILCCNLISKCGNPFVWTTQLRKRRTICVGRHCRRIFCCMKSFASGARWREL